MIGLGSKFELGFIGCLADLLLRGFIVTQQTEKTLHNVLLALGAFFVTVVVVFGITSLRPGAWIERAQKQLMSEDVVPKEWFPDVDKEAPKSPEAVTKAAYEKVMREVQKGDNTFQPQQGWNQGWKK